MIGCSGQERAYSFEMSNLGFMDNRMPNWGTENNWKRGRMLFSRNASALSPGLGCAIITGADGCLALGYNW